MPLLPGRKTIFAPSTDKSNIYFPNVFGNAKKTENMSAKKSMFRPISISERKNAQSYTIKAREQVLLSLPSCLKRVYNFHRKQSPYAPICAQGLCFLFFKPFSYARNSYNNFRLNLIQFIRLLHNFFALLPYAFYFSDLSVF